jgi:hypothetical protein
VGDGVGVTEATGATVITTLTRPLESVVPGGVTSATFTVSLAVTWARSIGWVLILVNAVRVDAGPVTVTVRGRTSIPVTV